MRSNHVSPGPVNSVPSRSLSGPPMMQSPDGVIDALRKLATDASPSDDPASVHIRAGALFARLKALNRDANAAARAHKQITADARHEMDQTHLRLQNLLYEKRHLEREIEKCRQFACVPFQSVSSVPSRSPHTPHCAVLCIRTYRCIQLNNSLSSPRRKRIRMTC
jgi:hypothetical protein